MSRETITHLNQQTLIGYTDKRGTAWHYRADEQGAEPNHYTGPIPTEDVRRRLFNWKALEGQITATALTQDGVLTTTAEDRKAIMRSDTGAILGVFKSGYQVHDYDQWLIQNVENLLDADLHIGSAGLLKGGAVAWVQVEMDDTLETEGVQFRPFLTAATSLDGSLASTYQVGAQVVVCDNTLSVALGADSAHRVRVRHSAKSLGRINDVRAALNIVHHTAEAFTEQVDRLTRVEVTDQQWAKFLGEHFQASGDSKRSQTITERKRAEVDHFYSEHPWVAPWKGTGWGVLSAINTWTHHGQDVRGASRAERNMERAVKGQVAQVDAGALSSLEKVLA